MAGKNTGLQRTYQIGDADGVAMYTGVTYGTTDGSVIKPTVDNAVFVGVVDNDERINDPLRAGGSQAGRDVAVQVTGYGAIKLSGTVSYGDRLILGVGGVAKKLPSGTGAAETATIKVLTACTSAGNITVTLNGEANTVAVDTTNQDTAAKVATAIATAIDALAGYTATAASDTVTITAVAKGTATDASFDGAETGVTATVTTTVQGVVDNSGYYNVIGYAEKAGVNNDIIPFKICPHIVTVA